MEDLERKFEDILDILEYNIENLDPDTPSEEDLHWTLVDIHDITSLLYNRVLDLDKLDPYNVAIRRFEWYIKNSENNRSSVFYDKQKEAHNREIWRMCIDRIKQRQQKAMKK